MDMPLSEGETIARMQKLMSMEQWALLLLSLEGVTALGWGSVTIQVERSRPRRILQTTSSNLEVD